jgi:hypothetical protein
MRKCPECRSDITLKNVKYCSLLCKFNNNFSRGEGCWVWEGHYDRLYEYGYLTRIKPYGYHRDTVQSHKYSYEVHNNTTLPRGAVVLHSCDNPRCVNPHHLTLGTHTSNHVDMRAKDRHTRGVKKRLSDDEVVEIKRDFEKFDKGKRTFALENAERYGVKPQTLYFLLKGRTYKNIEVC